MRVLTLYPSQIAAPAKVVNSWPGVVASGLRGSSQKHVVCLMEFSGMVLASTVETHFHV
jgi:hypothetical protein